MVFMESSSSQKRHAPPKSKMAASKTDRFMDEIPVARQNTFIFPVAKKSSVAREA